MNPQASYAEAGVTPIGGCEECGMAKFMDVRSGFVGVTADQLREAHERDLK